MKARDGFTLVELMVVIAIIGILSSIIVGNVVLAKQKGKDAALIAEVRSFRTLLELNYADYGSYTLLEPQSWFRDLDDCQAYLSGGTYAAQAQKVCAQIYNLNGVSSNNFFAPTHFLFIGNINNDPTQYSVMTFLPGAGTFYCLGSSGRSSANTTLSNMWVNPGCYNNP